MRALRASDIWAALRLPTNAASDVVRQAFRRESRLLHPDKNPLPEAEGQVLHSAPYCSLPGQLGLITGYSYTWHWRPREQPCTCAAAAL